MCSSRSPPPIPTTASWARRWARRTLQASGSKARARPSRALRMRSAYWVSGAPAGVDAQRVEQRRDGVEAPRVVVVAGDDDGWYAGAVQLAKERVDQPLRLGRGRRRIEDIAGDEEAVGFLRAGVVEHLLKRRLLLGVAALAAHRAADVPVGGVEEPHTGIRVDKQTGRSITARCSSECARRGRQRLPTPPPLPRRRASPRTGRGTGRAAAPARPAAAGTCCPA